MDILTPINGMTFGCDPELFIVDSKGVPLSPEDFLPGTKTEPYKINKGAVQVDGMAAEFNIDPAENFAEFNGNIEAVMKTLKTMIPKGAKFAIQPSITFTKETFDNASQGAKELGCTPDYNAWTGEVNPAPDPTKDPYMRCAGGHLHIGWTNDETPGNLQHVMNCTDIVQQLDWFLGLWSLKKDKDTARRSLYGKAGACRIKPYGVEYRVLSNFWIKDKASRVETWNRMISAVAHMKHGFMPQVAKGVTGYAMSPQIISSIDTGVVDPLVTKFFNFPVNTIKES